MKKPARRPKLNTSPVYALNELHYTEPSRYVPRNGALRMGLFGRPCDEGWVPPSSRELQSAHDPKRPWRRRPQVKTWPQLALIPGRARSK